jgi:hypothetical protein
MLMLAFTATRFFNFPLSEKGYVAMMQVSTFLVTAALAYGTWRRGRPSQDALEPA